MKVGLYFGSFNPIHTGHLIIANYIIENADIEKIWFVVSPHNPLKESNTLLNEYDRLHLVRLAIETDNRFKAIDVEFKLPKPSFTIDTLTYLTEKYPTTEFKIIMGADSFQNIEKWKNYPLLLKNYSIIVYNRPKFDVKPQKNVEIVTAPLLDISSTYIRNCIKQKKSIKYLVNEPVFEEISRNNYYK